jgi:hypothetical protein
MSQQRATNKRKSKKSKTSVTATTINSAAVALTNVSPPSLTDTPPLPKKSEGYKRERQIIKLADHLKKNTDVATAETEESKKPVTMTQEQLEEYMNGALAEASKVWTDVKDIAKTNKSFEGWEDKKKISYFRDDLGYKNFMNDYPITTRCMIIQGRYSARAFKRFLLKCKNVKHPASDKRPKGYMEDEWIKRQADYIRYLWEDYSKGHFNTREANEKWQEAYTALKAEMDDFRDTHEETKKQVEEEKKKHKVEVLRELLHRLKTSEQKLSEENEIRLLELLNSAKSTSSVPAVPQEEYDPRSGIRVIKHSDPICVDAQGNLLSEVNGNLVASQDKETAEQVKETAEQVKECEYNVSINSATGNKIYTHKKDGDIYEVDNETLGYDIFD